MRKRIFITTFITLLLSLSFGYLLNANIVINLNNVYLYGYKIPSNILIFSIQIIWLLLGYKLVKSHKIFKPLFIFTVVIYNIIYIIWRVLYTIPNNKIGKIIGIILLTCELFGFFQSMMYAFLFYKPYKLKKCSIKQLKELPHVDILIMTYNEPAHILRKTIGGALNIRYPKEKKHIFVCDDGRREEIKQLCDFMGVEHIIRINNKGAKAGNINNCLRNHSRSLYFSVLDADMIPKPTFLEQMMGYFKDKNIGFVQSPQVFYNADPYQFNLELNVYNDQDFFMREVQVGRDKYNAIVQIGTNAVFLRKAIDDIGGIPEDSITEDCATGMLVQAKGYKTIFVNEVLAVGLSPEHFRDLSKQRKRWSRGNIQVSKKHNPLTIKGLNIKQRLIYISGILFWYNSVFKMCFILTPIIYLLSGILIIDTDLISVTQFFIPSYLSYMLMFKSHNSKYTTLFRTHINETSLTCALFIPILMELVLSKELKFNVTNKGILAKNTFVSWNLLIPNFILFVLTILGFGVSANKFFINNSLELRGAILINIAWAVYNLIAIVATMMLCIEKPRKEELERKVINYRTTINETTHCVINNLSDSDFNIGINDLSCNLQLDDVFKISINNINVFSKIVDCHDNTFECRFIKLTKNQYLHILKFIYNDKSQGYYEEKNNSVIMQYNSFVTFMDSNELFAETEELKENCNIQVRTNEDLIIESKENTKKILSPMDMEMEDFLTQLDLDKKDIMLIKMYNELKNLKRNEKEVI